MLMQIRYSQYLSKHSHGYILLCCENIKEIEEISARPQAPQLIKFVQKTCSIRLPNIKSANALSGDTSGNSALFAVCNCIRREAVKTNCPTVAEKPARKALNG